MNSGKRLKKFINEKRYYAKKRSNKLKWNELSKAMENLYSGLIEEGFKVEEIECKNIITEFTVKFEFK